MDALLETLSSIAVPDATDPGKQQPHDITGFLSSLQQAPATPCTAFTPIGCAKPRPRTEEPRRAHGAPPSVVRTTKPCDEALLDSLLVVAEILEAMGPAFQPATLTLNPTPESISEKRCRWAIQDLYEALKASYIDFRRRSLPPDKAAILHLLQVFAHDGFAGAQWEGPPNSQHVLSLVAKRKRHRPKTNLLGYVQNAIHLADLIAGPPAEPRQGPPAVAGTQTRFGLGKPFGATELEILRRRERGPGFGLHGGADGRVAWDRGGACIIPVTTFQALRSTLGCQRSRGQALKKIYEMLLPAIALLLHTPPAFRSAEWAPRISLMCLAVAAVARLNFLHLPNRGFQMERVILGMLEVHFRLATDQSSRRIPDPGPPGHRA